MVLGLNPGRSKKFFSLPKLSARVWGTPSFLFNMYWDSSRQCNEWVVKLTTHVPRLGMCGAEPLFPLRNSMALAEKNTAIFFMKTALSWLWIDHI